jgi:hypothetical protein
MGSKNEPGDFDCYHNALPDEPMFILLARDPSSPERVEDWATERQRLIDKGFKPKSDQAMVDEAIRCAANMRRWRVVNNGAWRSPSPIPEAPGGREEIIEECAEIARSMKMAAAYANVYGRLSEAYGAVEVSILALKPQDGGSTVANEDISTNPAPRLHAFQAAGRREHEQPMPHRSADIVTALDAIEAQLHEMRSLKGWRLNLIRENLAKAKAAVGVAQASADTVDTWLIVKRGLYYRPDCKGYTGIKDEAGRYSREVADEHAAAGGTIMREADGPEFMPVAYNDLVIKHLTNQRDEARQEIERLRGAAQARLTHELMNRTTVSSTGKDITIVCIDHDTKDAIMAALVDTAYAAPSSPAVDSARARWTPEQFWQFTLGLTDANVRDQLRGTMTERGLSVVPSTNQLCPDCGRSVDGPTHAAYCVVSRPHGEAGQ